MRKLLGAGSLALLSLFLLGPAPATAATSPVQWVCDIQGPVTQTVLYDHFGPYQERWTFDLSGTCTGSNGRRAALTSRSVYPAVGPANSGLCDDAGVLPPFAANAFVGSTLAAADGYTTQLYHSWGIAPATTSAVGGPTSTVTVGGNAYPTGPDSPDLTGSGVAFIHIFGQCPPPTAATTTTNARFVLALTETRT
jgi:hypothetical protein